MADHAKPDNRNMEALGWAALAVLAGTLFFNGLLPALDELRDARARADTERKLADEMTEQRDDARARANALERGDELAQRAALLGHGYVLEGHTRLVSSRDALPEGR